MNENQGWKIGELAKRTGLTVRTLHHYDHVGLLTPSQHTDSGHRIYSLHDVKKLQQILSLKQLGLSLEEIKRVLVHNNYDPLELMNLQLCRLDEQIQAQTALRQQISEVLNLLKEEETIASDHFLTVIQMLNLMQSPHFSSTQIKEIRNRYYADNGESDAQNLIEKFRMLWQEKRPPDDSEVLLLAESWKKEMQKHSLMDEALVRSAEQYYRENPGAASYFGMDGDLYAFIKEAVSHLSST